MVKSAEKIVICGAGIAGVAAAYYLAVEYGCADVVLIEEANPLSLTSDKSTEGYRNWWPGPDQAMTAFMNRSIDLMQGIARGTGNRIGMNRRGYLFATARSATVARLISLAERAEALGSGPVRIHSGPSAAYRPSPEPGFEGAPTGADVMRAMEGPLAAVRDIRPENLSYDGAAESLPQVWIAVRAALRSVLERVTVADVVAGKLPRSVAKLLDDPEAWKPH